MNVDKDKFALKGLSGYFFQFHTDAKGVVKDDTSMQPNGNFIARKK